ncbi:Peptidyl-Lys metalloendopeptidase [Grifola frondosa]|uniref:Peptidyl-Lys metalloendopeptidase n=1 Tax=Grifola frondosa TaxID=5627 RepID=A0A1C7MLF2_GRIFR|nr:Peptidyl-Lys metalloendopeptidase [Grifola frondosa]
MFAHSVLLSLVASALTFSATPGLRHHVTGLTVVDGIGNLKVIATEPTDIFIITKRYSMSPEFVGMNMSKYVPSVASELGDFITLASGKELEIEHNLSEAYDFSVSGPG